MLSVSEYARVRQAITRGTSIAIRTRSYSSRHRVYVDRVLSLYLYELGLIHLHNNLAYCIHELAGNARNALLKRLWFREQGIDIAERGSNYAEAVRRFRREVGERPQHFLELLESSGDWILFRFSATPRQVRISVENTGRLLPVEMERVREKLAAAERFQSVADAYGALSDFSEGAGLGIAMVVVILKRLGLPAQTLRIGNGAAHENVTRALLVLDRTSAAADSALVQEVQP